MYHSISTTLILPGFRRQTHSRYQATLLYVPRLCLTVMQPAHKLSSIPLPPSVGSLQREKQTLFEAGEDAAVFGRFTNGSRSSRQASVSPLAIWGKANEARKMTCMRFMKDILGWIDLSLFLFLKKRKWGQKQYHRGPVGPGKGIRTPIFTEAGRRQCYAVGDDEFPAVAHSRTAN